VTVADALSTAANIFSLTLFARKEVVVFFLIQRLTDSSVSAILFLVPPASGHPPNKVLPTPAVSVWTAFKKKKRRNCVAKYRRIKWKI